jgi:hypothetical protein
VREPGECGDFSNELLWAHGGLIGCGRLVEMPNNRWEESALMYW